MAEGSLNAKTLVERARESTFPGMVGADSPGYATAQFGKSRVGDCNEHLPIVYGFDEVFGNLYHLNAKEEPENSDHPKDPRFSQRFGRRRIPHTWAADTDDLTVDPQFGRVGKQKIENIGR
jgi:arylsulfatase A-like enzyme